MEFYKIIDSENWNRLKESAEHVKGLFVNDVNKASQKTYYSKEELDAERAKVKDSNLSRIKDLAGQIEKFEADFLKDSKEQQEIIRIAKARLAQYKFTKEESEVIKDTKAEITEAKRELRKIEGRKEKINEIIRTIKNNPLDVRFRELKEVKSAKNGRWLTTERKGYIGTRSWEVK